MDDKKKDESLFERHRENIYFRWGLTAFLVIVACVLVALFMSNLALCFGYVKWFFGILSPALYGLVIAYLLDPVVTRIALKLTPQFARRMKRPEKAEKVSRFIGTMAALLVLLLVIYAIIAMILPQLIESITQLVKNLNTYFTSLQKWITGLIDNNLAADTTDDILSRVYNYLNSFLTNTLLPKLQSTLVEFTNSVVSMAKMLFNLIIGLIISVYLLLDKRKFVAQAKKISYAVLGQKWGGKFGNLCTFTNHTFGGFISGKIVDSIIIGVLCFIGMTILQLPYVMLISIVVGVTNIIPFFGPYIGAIPSALLILGIDPMQCLYFVIFILILQQVDGNIIGPKILGDATGLSGFWVVVAILVFGSLFGFVGMIIGVPVFAVIYRIIGETANWLLQKHALSTKTRDYENWYYPPRPPKPDYTGDGENEEPNVAPILNEDSSPHASTSTAPPPGQKKKPFWQFWRKKS